ncbi:MAG: glycosyltransferase family 2 protein, partial [Candidatus Binataceae bacterium]
MSASSAPLVSVVIATYNRPAYLRNAIASVVNGDYRNVEIIVADDFGSGDNRKIAGRFADPRIVYHRNEANLGIAANHIHAFRDLISSEFIAVLNDDDEWETSFLSKLMPHLLDNLDVVLAFSDHYIIDEHSRIDLAATGENTRRWRRDILSPGLHQPFWRCLLDKSIPVAQASVIRRGAIDWHDFPVEAGAAWDVWLGYLACRTGKACYYHP